jgi:cell division protein FtsZ
VRQFVAPVPGIRLGQVPSSVRQTASLHPERQEEDLRIPAYIRRQLSINDPHEVAGQKNTAHDTDYNPSISGGRGEHEDKIQKGLSDTPAYLRRKNNGI